MKPAPRAAFFGLALGVSLGVAVLVYRGHTSHWLAVVWFLSLFPFVQAARGARQEKRQGASALATAMLLLIAAVAPVLVRVANMDPARMHTDEFITGYFSATHDFGHSPFPGHADAAKPGFFGYIPEKWEWQGQFPKPYFFVQRVFFTLFGTSTLTLRLSVQIYVALVSVMLFLIVREILDRRSALVAVGLYSFFAISIYMETVGLFFISSTAVFTVFFYFALRAYRTGAAFYAALSGIACGFCYLMYYSSYLAFPVLVAFVVLHWLRVRKIFVLQNFLIALGGMLAVLAPFLALGLRSGDYILRRASDMSLLTGGWSKYREPIAKGTRTALSVIGENLTTSLKSFGQNGIGGHGGHNFGHLAFFDPFSLGLFLAGLLAGLLLLSRRTELFFVFLVIGASFLTGIVLTIPPPAYHRFTIAFPFLVVVMTLPFYFLFRIPQLPMSGRYALAAGLLLLFACVNERWHVEAVCLDAPSEDLRLAKFLDQRYPGRSVYVASYGGFGYDKVLYFVMKTARPRKIQTDYHEAFLKAFDRNEKYVYVILFPSVFDKQFVEADPNGRLFRFSNNWSVFAN